MDMKSRLITQQYYIDLSDKLKPEQQYYLKQILEHRYYIVDINKGSPETFSVIPYNKSKEYKEKQKLQPQKKTNIFQTLYSMATSCCNGKREYEDNYKSIDGRQLISFVFSNSFLIHENEIEYKLFIIDELPFAQGGFGKIFSNNRVIVINKKTGKLQELLDDNVAKWIEKDDTSLDFNKLLERECELLKEIDPKTILIKKNKPASLTSNYPEGGWIITKKLPGQTLDLILENKSNSLNINNKFNIAISLLCGLLKLHDPNEMGGEYFHNDIKPSNIIIDSNFHASYIDFGAVCKTGETVKIGTPVYMEPRKLNFRSKASSSNDIHALGIVLFQLFIGNSQLLPSSKHKKLSKHYNIPRRDINHGSVKVCNGLYDKLTYAIKPNTKSKAIDCKIDGLNTTNAKRVFKLIEQMVEIKGSSKTLEYFYSEFKNIATHHGIQYQQNDIPMAASKRPKELRLS